MGRALGRTVFGTTRSDVPKIGHARGDEGLDADEMAEGGVKPLDAGNYTENETGLLCLTHRYYDTGTGRFLTRDSKATAGGLNLYGGFTQSV